MQFTTIFFIVLFSTSVWANEPPCHFSGSELSCRVDGNTKWGGVVTNLGSMDDMRNFKAKHPYLYSSTKPGENLPTSQENLLKAKLDTLHVEIEGKNYIFKMPDISLEEVWKIKDSPLKLQAFLAEANNGQLKKTILNVSPNTIRVFGPTFKSDIDNFVTDYKPNRITTIRASVEPYVEGTNGVHCNYTNRYNDQAHQLKSMGNCGFFEYHVGEVYCIDYKLNQEFTTLVSCNSYQSKNATDCFIKSDLKSETRERQKIKKVTQ